ncbi:tyrosine-type recombinase/integrase [Pedobacter immunditicola]|uniref:tyrosine-type recombinase/integrase n=1 Tax=Pedobacter immunditicola TaxID=3133440 RepID=UPI00309C1040
MVIETFLSYLSHEKRYSPHTIISYQNDLRQFNDYLKSTYELELLEAKYVQIRDYIVFLMSNDIGANSVGRKMSSLRSFYKYNQRQGLIASNPLAQIKSPKAAKPLPVFIDDQKLDQLLDSELLFNGSFASQRDKVLLEVLFGTGMRMAELMALKDSDVNFYEGTVKVMGKGGKQRIIPLPNPLNLMLKEFIHLKSLQNFDNKSEALIVNNTGNNATRTFIYSTVKSYLTYISTQEKRSPHVLRHSYATSLLNRGADLNAIKELLGHASLASTEVYTHNSIERLKTIYKQAHPKA